VRGLHLIQRKLAIDDRPQDAAGKQGTRAWQSGNQEIWVRELAGGDRALAVFNRGGDPAAVKVKWADLGMKTPQSARDLWAKKDVPVPEQMTVEVPGHGVAMWRVK
jgi:alpha-galactosidase